MYRKGIGENPSPLFSTPAGGGVASDSFRTIACPSGTNPVADSATDTLTLAAGSGITITGDSATDTITIAATSATIPAGTATYDHLEWNGSAWVNVANLTMATAASLSWNGTSASMTTSGGTFVLTTNNVFGGSVVAGSQVFSWVSGSVKIPGTNTLKFGTGSTEYIYSSGANALDITSNTNLYLRIGGTIEATLTSNGLLMAGVNYVAFNAATEKIWSSVGNQLDITSTTMTRLHSGGTARLIAGSSFYFDVTTSAHEWYLGGTKRAYLSTTPNEGYLHFYSDIGAADSAVATWDNTTFTLSSAIASGAMTISSAGTSATLTLNATSSQTFQIAAAAEMTLTAQKLTFDNGAAGTRDVHLNWDAADILGVGFDCASPALTNFQHFKLQSTVSGSNVYANLLFRAYSIDDGIGTSKDVAYFQARYTELSDNDNLYLFLDGSDVLSFQKTSLGVLSATMLGTAFAFSQTKLDMVDGINAGYLQLSGGTLTLRHSAASSNVVLSAGSGGSPYTAALSADKFLFGNTTNMNIRVNSGSSCSMTFANEGAGAFTVNLVSSSDWSFTSSALTIGDANNIVINTTTGTKIGTGATQKIGFWNATPVVQSTGYAITNKSSDKTLDCNATSVDELADVLGTLIDDLKTYGILGA